MFWFTLGRVWVDHRYLVPFALITKPLNSGCQLVRMNVLEYAHSLNSPALGINSPLFILHP